ncbi:hypothetical protein BDV93DRAFT_77190 [Ceratobasidium sp. AG-I]|nr:hypothetical protein BDV93DRAFT_77190 [Ceratobasidium sp. AG-I]
MIRTAESGRTSSTNKFAVTPFASMTAASTPRSTIDQIESKSIHSIAIPELLQFISSFLSRSDAVRFAQSSRMCFYAAVDHVWYSVPNPCYLLALLPRVSFEEKDKYRTTYALLHLASCDFKRFDFYAPLVKRLEIFHEPFYSDTSPGWSWLINYTKQRPLLPNLRHLIFDSSTLPSGLFWVNVFLFPTLLSIQDHASLCRRTLSYNVAASFLSNISARCPVLHELSLFPDCDEGETEPWVLNPSVLLFHPHLSSLRNLRTLCTTMIIFNGAALQVLGELPQLDTLKIRKLENSDFDIPISSATLPADAFPALRNLCLPKLDISEFETIWTVQQLIARPVRLEVCFSSLALETDPETLLSEVSQHSPQISDLVLEFHPRTAWPQPNFLLALQGLSLGKLCIQGVDIFVRNTLVDTLLVTCPLLRVLHLDYTSVSIPQLCCFTQLSRLESLHIDVEWETCQELDVSVPPLLGVSRNFRQLSGNRCLNLFVDPPLIKRTVLFLLSFWPELKLVTSVGSQDTPDCESSLPGAIDRYLQGILLARRCNCGVCLRTVAEAGYNVSR